MRPKRSAAVKASNKLESLSQKISEDLAAAIIHEVPSSDSEFEANSEEEEIEDEDEASDMEPEVVDLASSGDDANESGEGEEEDGDSVVVAVSARVKKSKPSVSSKASPAFVHSYAASDSSASDDDDDHKQSKNIAAKPVADFADKGKGVEEQGDRQEPEAEEDGNRVEEAVEPSADYNNQDYLDLIALLKRALAHEFKSSTITVSSTSLVGAPTKSSASNGANTLMMVASSSTAQATETESSPQEYSQEITILDTKKKRIPCPLTCCSKSFLNFEGIKYHLLNFVHDVSNLGTEWQEEEFQALFTQIKEKEVLVPLNLLPIEIPWTFNTRERIKPLLLKVRFVSPPPKIKVTVGKKLMKMSRAASSSESLARLPKALRGSEEADLLTPKLTRSTAELKVPKAINASNADHYIDSGGEFVSRIDHELVYPESFADGKFTDFIFSGKEGETISIPLLDSTIRRKLL